MGRALCGHVWTGKCVPACFSRGPAHSGPVNHRATCLSFCHIRLLLQDLQRPYAGPRPTARHLCVSQFLIHLCLLFALAEAMSRRHQRDGMTVSEY